MNSPTSATPTSKTPLEFTDEHYEEISSRLARSFVAATRTTIAAMHEETGIENGSTLSFLTALAVATTSAQFAVTEALLAASSTSITPREFSEYFARSVTETIKLYYEAADGADVAK